MPRAALVRSAWVGNATSSPLHSTTAKARRRLRCGRCNRQDSHLTICCCVPLCATRAVPAGECRSPSQNSPKPVVRRGGTHPPLAPSNHCVKRALQGLTERTQPSTTPATSASFPSSRPLPTFSSFSALNRLLTPTPGCWEAFLEAGGRPNVLNGNARSSFHATCHLDQSLPPQDSAPPPRRPSTSP